MDKIAAVLIVDDNPGVLYVKSRVLGGKGYRILEAVTGEEALTIAAAAQPDAVVLDVHLPDIDGFEVCRRLKRDAATRHIKILHTSAVRITAPDRIKGLECGTDAYLIEPVEEEELVSAVGALVRLAEQERENRRLIDKLTRTERQLRKATEAADCGIWDWDILTGQVDWFGAHERLAGMKPGSFGGKVEDFTDVLHPDDRGRVWRKVEDRMARRETHYEDEYRFIHPDGTVRWMSATGRFFYNEDGEAVRMTGVVQDIAERKAAEDRLRESEERVRLALEGADMGSWDVDLRTGRAIWNRRHAALQGYGAGDEPHTMDQWRSRVHPGDLDRVLAAAEEAKRGRTPFAVEHRVCLPQSSEPRWLSLYGRFTYDEAGAPVRFSGVSLDITERKRAEDALKQVTESLSLAQRASGSGVWDWKVTAGPSAFVSPEYRALYGLAADEPMSYEKWLTLVHPDDRERMERYGREVFQRGGPDYNVEFRILHPSRGVRWVAGLGRIERNEVGEPIRFTGVNLDITERKRAEAEAEEGRRLLQAILQYIPEGLTIADAPDVTIRHVSDYGRRLTGRPAEAIEGIPAEQHSERWGIFQADGVTPARNEDLPLTRATKHGEIVIDEEWVLARPDGSKLILLCNAGPVRDEQGRLVGGLITWRDISERKRAEAALREAQERVQRWNVELEQAVNDKTAELTHSQERLRALATELNLAEQRERKRIATDLHDHLQQMLVLGKLKLGQGKRLAFPLPACVDIMKQVDDVLSEALTYTRTLVAELSPPVLRDHGLAAGLKWLGESMKKKHDLTVTVLVPDDESRGLKLPDDQAVLLFQSVRELLVNSWKYAGTGQATVSMDYDEKYLRIEVRDEGAGFDLAAAAAAAAAAAEPTGGLSSKFGLFSIRERMKALGGSFDIQSAPGKGTTATLVLPLGGKTSSMFEVQGSKLIAG
jgi:PAS domain S-box-containing protein